MDPDAYRGQAEAFLTELTAEYRRHFAGLSDEYAIEPIYARHGTLFTAGAVAGLRAELAAASGPARRGLRMLLAFAVDGHVGEATKAIDAELARLEASLTISAAGRTFGFRESLVAQANEPDAGRRAEIERARLEATERVLNPLHREAHVRRTDATAALGYESYAGLCASVQEVDLDELAAQTAAFLAATADAYPALLEPQLERTLGFGPDRLRRADLPRFFRAADLDRFFPDELLLDCLARTLAQAGIDVRAQPRVRLDVEARPRKSPRAFCAPVRVPDEVHLVIAPTGGRDDVSALLHEAGHAEHYAHVDADLPFEFRCLGDNAITECFAFLLQHLAENPAWLVSRTPAGPAEAEAIRAHARAERLVYLRRYAGKLAYELELHGGAADFDGALPDRYAAILGAAIGVPWSRETYLADVDSGFYCACYLRAWALETHLRAHLVDVYGPDWFESRAAWDELRALWREGQRMTPEELLRAVSGREPLDFGVLAGDLGIAA